MIERKARFLSVFLLVALLSAAGLQAQGEVFDIPGIGEVGIEKNGKTWTVGLGDWGTWEFTGTFKNKKDFDLATSMPAGDFTDYIPGVGQLLSIMGLSTVDLRLKPSGLGIGMNLESGGLGALRGTITDNLSRIKGVGVVIDKVIEGLELKSMTLNGSVFGKTLKGEIKGSLAVIGKTFSFSADGELSLKKLVDNIMDKIVPAVTDYATGLAKAAYQKSKDQVLKVGKTGAAKAEKAWNAVSDALGAAWDIAKKATSSYDHNKDVDLPRLVQAMGNPMLGESNKAIDAMYNELAADVRYLPDNEKQTMVDSAFAGLVADLDKRWDKIRDDRSTDKWTVMEKREKELHKMFQKGIDKKWDEHRDYRNQAIARLKQLRPVVRLPRTAAQTLADLATYANGRIPVMVEICNENLAWDVQGGWNQPAANGTNVFFYDVHGNANQQWLLVPAGQPNTYHFRSVHSGRYIHIDAAKDVRAQSLKIWDGAGAQYRQTVFKASADQAGFVHLTTDNGLAFDLQDGIPRAGQDLRLWDNNGSPAQAFYIYPAPQPANVARLYPNPSKFQPVAPDQALNQLANLARSETPVIIETARMHLAWDIVGGWDKPAGNGANVHFYNTHRNANQQWILVPAGQPNTYHFRSVHSGRYIHIDAAKDVKGQSLKIWDGASPEARQTIFKAVAEPDGSIQFSSMNGLALDLEGGVYEGGRDLRLWEPNHSDAQKFVVSPVTRMKLKVSGS